MEATELELKFAVPDKALPQLAAHPAFAAPAHTSRLRSIYFDTPARDLRNACLGLRVRENDDGSVQNLKWEKHSAPFVRREWETHVRSLRPDPRLLADTPAGEVLDGRGHLLEPVFTTCVDRTRHLWTRGDDVVEVSLDRGDITSGTRGEPIQELELELKAGDPQAVFDLASALTEDVKLPLMFLSKAERGYRLADDLGWQAERPQPISIPADMPAADAFREVGRNCLAQIAINAELVSRCRSLEALHQLRVGLRRFRAALAIFRPIVEDSAFRQVRGETKWLAGQLDPARDLDVFIHQSFRPFHPQRADREAFARLGAQLLHAQTKAYDQALAVLASRRFAKLVLTATRWLEIGAWTTSEEPVIQHMRLLRIDAFAGGRLDRLRHQVRRRGRHLRYPDEEGRHQLRIEAKRLRYSADFFSGSFGRNKRQKRLVQSLAQLQDKLGRLHDIIVSPPLALKLVRGKSASAGFAAGLIVAAQRASAARNERAALKAFDKFDRAKPFWN